MITTSIDILISKDSGRGLTGLVLVILAGTIRKLTIQAERRIVDTSCPLRGEENGMTGLVHILNSIFVKCVVSLRRQWVGSRAVSLQSFSLEVFKFIADPSFAFVSSDYIRSDCSRLPANKEMFIKQLKKRYGGWWSFSHSPSKTKRAIALILVYILATVCYAREGSNGLDNLVLRVLFLCLLRDEERLGKRIWTSKLALVGKLACPPPLTVSCRCYLLFADGVRISNQAILTPWLHSYAIFFTVYVFCSHLHLLYTRINTVQNLLLKSCLTIITCEVGWKLRVDSGLCIVWYHESPNFYITCYQSWWSNKLLREQTCLTCLPELSECQVDTWKIS